MHSSVHGPALLVSTESVHGASLSRPPPCSTQFAFESQVSLAQEGCLQYHWTNFQGFAQRVANADAELPVTTTTLRSWQV